MNPHLPLPSAHHTIKPKGNIFKMIKLMPKRFSRSSSSSKLGHGGAPTTATAAAAGDIKWELRPGGMLVQKRETNQDSAENVMITIRVSTVSQWHDISVRATSTFGELKIAMSILTNIEAEAQRLLFKGKEREDKEHLHMVGVRDKDKVLLLEDPSLKERKLLGLARARSVLGSSPPPPPSPAAAYRTISV